MTEKILLGFEKDSGEPVEIDVMHSVFAGITRIGKSETVKAAVSRSEDMRFLILDVKRPRDYPDIGEEIPIYIEEKTEPLMLKRLLESQSHLALKFEFPELLKVCKKARTYENILEEVNKGLEAKKHPIVKDKLLVLQHLLTRLVNELKQTPITDRLELKGRINVMDLSNVSQEMQQLAVHSTLKTLLEKHSNIVVIADEFHRFAPQYGSNPSKETVTTYIKEGGAKNLWLWVIDQTITGVDKDILKQCWVWVLAKQRELNEAKRTLDQIPFKTGLTDKAIMRLKVGHFIVCTEDFAKLTYIWLPAVPEEMAQKVSRGELDVREVIKYLDKKREKEEETDLKRVERIEQDLARLISVVNSLEETFRVQETEITKLRDKLQGIELQEIKKATAELHGKFDALKELKTVKKTIDLKHIEDVINLSHSERTIEMDTATQKGQIMYVAVKDFLEKPFTIKEMSEALKERGWNIVKRSLTPTISSHLVGDGLLIRVPKTRPTKYRLPKKLKVNVEKKR